MSAPVTIGIDVGGTSLRASVVTFAGSIVESRRVATPESAPALDDALARIVADLAAKHPVRAVGLAVAGFVSVDRTQVMFAPHLPWRNAPAARRLAEHCGLPVVMDHDVNCAAVAESRLGAARGVDVALVIALGTGIGCGLVLRGEVYRGAHGVAPELGHVVVMPQGRRCSCGKSGCLERYCSGTALAATAREFLDSGRPSLLTERELTGRSVAAAARDGDAVALDACAALGRWLGRAAAIAADVLDPGVIVIGGGVSESADVYLDVARRRLADELTGGAGRPAPTLVVAEFGGTAGVVGAALLAAERVS